MSDKKTSAKNTVVRRRYEIAIPGGGSGYITFTLGRRDADPMAAALALQTGAKAYGLVVLDYAPEPRGPMVWLQTATEFELWRGEDGPDLSEELIRIIGRCAAVFLNDIAEIGLGLPSSNQNGDGQSKGRKN
jgi:hypothetical protein